MVRKTKYIKMKMKMRSCNRTVNENFHTKSFLMLYNIDINTNFYPDINDNINVDVDDRIEITRERSMRLDVIIINFVLK